MCVDYLNLDLLGHVVRDVLNCWMLEVLRCLLFSFLDMCLLFLYLLGIVFLDFGMLDGTMTEIEHENNANL